MGEHDAYLTHKGRCGTQLIIPYRGDEHDTRHLKLMGDLGQVHMIVRKRGEI